MNEYTDCPWCQDLAYKEERGHVVTFDHDLLMKILNNILEKGKDDVHIAIDVSDVDDPWEFDCYHITWRRNLPKISETEE